MEVSKPTGLEQVWKTAGKEAKRLRAAVVVQPSPPARPPKTVKVKQKKSHPPPSPLVGRIMEMGFNRHQVEFAVRVTGVYRGGAVRGWGCGKALPLPVAHISAVYCFTYDDTCNSLLFPGNSTDADVIVTWLIEHMDEVPSAPPVEEEEEGEEGEEGEAQQEEPLPQLPKPAKPKPAAVPADIVVDEDSDSDSDAVEVDDGSADVPEPDTGDSAGYKSPADFTTKAEYAEYVKENVSVGSSVECCEAYEHVKVGDSGKVTKVS